MGEHHVSEPVCLDCGKPFTADSGVCSHCGGDLQMVSEVHVFENGELEGLMNLIVGPTEPYFVYVGSARHVWRFVHYAEAARDGDDAIDQAQAEARQMGSFDPDAGYMAVPHSAITTRSGARV